jgi:chemotaxis protein histidine kinase CheA
METNQFTNQLPGTAETDPKTIKGMTDPAREREELPLRLQTMERLVPAAAAGSRDALEEIIKHAHKLQGSAKIFSMARLGDAMVDMEDLLLRVSNDHFRDSSAWMRVDKALYLAKGTLDLESEDSTTAAGEP